MRRRRKRRGREASPQADGEGIAGQGAPRAAHAALASARPRVRRGRVPLLPADHDLPRDAAANWPSDGRRSRRCAPSARRVTARLERATSLEELARERTADRLRPPGGAPVHRERHCSLVAAPQPLIRARHAEFGRSRIPRLDPRMRRGTRLKASASAPHTSRLGYGRYGPRHGRPCPRRTPARPRTARVPARRRPLPMGAPGGDRAAPLRARR